MPGYLLGYSGVRILIALLHEMRRRSEWELLLLALRLQNTVWGSHVVIRFYWRN